MPTWELPKDIQLLFQMWDIRMQQGMEWPSNYNQFKIDCMKSALLHRMLDGLEPLEHPPPRSYSYPWYSIIQDGYGYPGEVWESDGHFLGPDVVVIDQCAWKLVKKLGERDWIVTYPVHRNTDWNNLEHFSKTLWHAYPVGCRWPRNPNRGSWDHYWYIEKIEDISRLDSLSNKEQP